MTYLNILAVPLKSKHTPTANLSEIAARASPDEVIELRIEKKGKTHCCIGIESELRLRQAKLVCSTNGFTFEEAAPPKAAEAKALLTRTVEKRMTYNGTTPTPHYTPCRIKSDEESSDTLFNALASCPDGTGICIYIRRGSLPQATLTALSKMVDTDPLTDELLRETERYEVVVAIYGPSEGVELLASEAAYAFGMAIEHISPLSLSPSLLDIAAKGLNPNERGLKHFYLREELETFTSIGGSRGLNGLPINKDTVCGFPSPLPSVKADEPTVKLGETADGKAIRTAIKELRKGMLVCGAPGTGKGNFIFNIALELYERDIPMLLIESAKREQHTLRKVIANLNCWSVKEGGYVMNPFAIPDGLTLGQYRSSLLKMMKVCFDMDGPLYSLFTEAMNNCFAKNGWSDQSNGALPFGLNEMIKEYNRLFEKSGYSKATKSDIQTAGQVRLKRLLEEYPGIFDTVNDVPMGALTTGNNVLQLDGLQTIEAKQMFASMLLIKLSAYLRLTGRHSSKGVKLCIILDESHNLLQTVTNTNANGSSYSFAKDFASMILELRSSGIAFIVADQSADNIPYEIASVLNTKLFFGGNLSNGIETYQNHLRINGESIKHTYMLEPGEFLFSNAKTPHAIYGKAEQVIDDFLEDTYYYDHTQNTFLNANPRLCVETYNECRLCPLRGRCTLSCKAEARRVTTELSDFVCRLNEASDTNSIAKVGDELVGRLKQKCPTPYVRICALIQIIRKTTPRVPIHMKELLTKAID